VRGYKEAPGFHGTAVANQAAGGPWSDPGRRGAPGEPPLPQGATGGSERKFYVDIATFAMGVIAGICAGVLIVGFLALGSYRRGYDDAIFRRKDWRAELVSRQAVASRAAQPTTRKAG